MAGYARMLAPGLPDLTTQAIDRIDAELERTAALHAVIVCFVCGRSGRPHAHDISPSKEKK